MSNLPTINPFVSEAQRAWMFANDPEMARKWAAVTPKGKKLPKRKRPTSNASKLRPGTISSQKNRRLAVARRSGKTPTFAGRIDPTRTSGLRRQFSAALKRQFDALKVRIVKLLVDENALGIQPTANTSGPVEIPFTSVPGTYSLITNTRWQFQSDPAKLQAFQDWLKQQSFDLLQAQSQHDLWVRYIQQGFRRGAGRSFDDVRMKKLAKKRPDLFTPAAQAGVRDFYAGTKDEFLQSSFGQPVAREKVQLLAERSFDELENVTADMGNRISRVLVDGFVQGHHPTKIAKAMSEQINISRHRAEVIARTEIIRAHAQGQLMALRQMGIDKVGVAVEWSTSEDNAVCELCAPMQGVVLTVDEAEGLIPRHPQCRCAWVPANVGEDEEGQVRDREDIEDALDESGIEL